MKRKITSVFTFGLLWLFVLALFSTTLSISASRKVIAAPEAYSAFCQPPTTLDDGVGWRPNGWLSLEIINRAQIKITIVPTGNCTNQNRTMDSVVGESPGKMKALLEEVLMDNNIGDDTWGYRSFVDGFSGDGVRDQTFMDYFRDGDVGSATSDPFGGNNMFVANLSGSFGGWTDEAQLVFGIEPGVFGTTLGGDNQIVAAAMAWTSIECDDGGNVALFDYESQFQWGCTSRTRDRKGLIVGGTFKDIENFNIVWIASPDGSKLTHVSKDLEGSQSFTWCGAENFTQPNGEKGRYRTNCASSTSGYYLEGPNANPKTMTEKASDNLIGVTVRKEGDSNPGYAGSVAGASSVAAGSSTAGGAGTSTVGSVDGDVEPSCETTSGFNLSWVLCPIINGLTTMSQGIFSSVIEPYLKTQPISAENTPENVTFKIWASFRTLGNIVLVFGLLFIVFGQSIGGGMLDAYTAKKAMPRILVAAILINLSIYLVAFMIDIANVLGAGIGMLITSPLRASDQYNFSIGGGTAGTLGAIAGVSALGIWLFSKIRNPAAPGAAWGPPAIDTLSPNSAALGDPTAASTGGSFMPFFLLFVLLPIALITLAIFATLIIRRGLIMFLVIISPVAIALYTLPQTEKYAKKWFESLMKTLMVYPIIVAIFSIAYVLSLTIIAANGGADEGTFSQFLAKIIGLIVLFVPLAMIPFAFKLAGGAIASLYGAISGGGKKFGEMVKGDSHNPDSLRNAAKRRAGERANRIGQGVVDRGRADNATRRSRFKSRFAQTIGGNIDQRTSRYNAARAKAREEMVGTGRDDLIYAAGGFLQTSDDPTTLDANGNALRAGQHYNSKLVPISRQMYSDGQRLYGGGDTNAAGAAFEYRLRKAQTQEDVGQFRTAFAKQAVANGWSQQEMQDVWAAATYPHKDKFASEWYSSPQLTTDPVTGQRGVKFKDVAEDNGSYSKMVGDIHKTRESFKYGALRGQEWGAMGKFVDDFETKLDTGASYTEQELKNYVMTKEILNAAGTKFGAQGLNPDGEVSVNGPSAEAQPIIKEAISRSRYDIGMNGDDRDVISKPRMTPLPPGVAGSPTPTPSRTVATTNVSGTADRAAVPRVVYHS